MTILSEDVVSRRLREVDQSQESIETTSMWIMHHKDSLNIILSGWMNVFRLATERQRLALFYVANDVCQKTKKKAGFGLLPSSFIPQLVSAISLIRAEEDTKLKVTRILDIWEQREIFDTLSLVGMRNALNMTFDENSDTDDRMLIEFDPANLVLDLQKFQKIEAAIDKARIILSKGNFNFQAQLRDRLKDRRGGQKFLKEVDETCKKMSDFVTALESQMNQHNRLIELLENARDFFGQQLRDATVVEDAYQKFGSGIQTVKDELEGMQRTGVYLGASPPLDAPSPSTDDDPFASGVEEAILDMKKPGARDLIETADMEVDLEEESQSAAMNADGMNLRTNQSFMDGSAMQQQMMHMLDHKVVNERKIDPRIERMQKAARQRIEAVNAQLGVDSGSPAWPPILPTLPPPPPPILPTLPPPPPLPPTWPPTRPNFSMPPPGLVNLSIPPPNFVRSAIQSNGDKNRSESGHRPSLALINPN